MATKEDQTITGDQATTHNFESNNPNSESDLRKSTDTTVPTAAELVRQEFASLNVNLAHWMRGEFSQFRLKMEILENVFRLTNNAIETNDELTFISQTGMNLEQWQQLKSLLAISDQKLQSNESCSQNKNRTEHDTTKHSSAKNNSSETDKNNNDELRLRVKKRFINQGFVELLDSLSKQELEIVTLSLGLEDGLSRSADWIGAILGTSTATIEEIELGALQKLDNS